MLPELIKTKVEREAQRLQEWMAKSTRVVASGSKLVLCIRTGFRVKGQMGFGGKMGNGEGESGFEGVPLRHVCAWPAQHVLPVFDLGRAALP